jgi:DNA-binding response OmpR family regulator
MMTPCDTPPLFSPPPLRLIVVEDHDLVRDELIAFLQRPQWRVRGAEDALALDALLRQEPADLFVIDLNLPGEDGLSICKRLRVALPEAGIIMLTARILPKDKTVGYRSGADVYLTKPANVGELEAAITNLARRLQPRHAPVGQLDLSRMLLVIAGHTVALNRLEVELLYALALAPQHQLDTDALIHRLRRTHTSMFDRSHLAVVISRLRTKVQKIMPEHELIKAVRGQGYQLAQVLALWT